VQKAWQTAVRPVPRACTTVARMVAQPAEPTAVLTVVLTVEPMVVLTAEPMVALTAEPMVARTAAWPAARDR